MERVGQGYAGSRRQLEQALRDARQTSTELALSALQSMRAISLGIPPRDAAKAAAADAGLNTSDGATVRLGAVTLPGVASSPAGPVTSDGTNNTINGGLIRAREGFTTDGIVPRDKEGNPLDKSGVTVGNGVDFYHQYGPRLFGYKFWKQVTTGDWQGVYSNLMTFGDKYSTQRQLEAGLLSQDTQSGNLSSPPKQGH